MRDSPERLTQLLLLSAGRRTFDRIAHCPSYPVPARDREAIGWRDALAKELARDPRAEILHDLIVAATPSSRRKQRGQYFTPVDTAKAALTGLRISERDIVLDAGSGACGLALAILDSKPTSHLPLYVGIENDPILALAGAVALEARGAPTGWRILYRNYLATRVDALEEEGYGRPTIVISNPPYVRFQRFRGADKMARGIAVRAGISLGGFSGLHAYFIAHSTTLLAPGGRMVFLLPPEARSTQYGRALAAQLGERYELTWEAIEEFRDSRDAIRYKLSIFPRSPRAPPPMAESISVPLSSIIKISRGISTGKNEYFVLTAKEAEETGIPRRFLKRVVPTRIRLPDRVFDDRDFRDLEKEGAACWLLVVPRETPMTELPAAVQTYVRRGIREGIHQTPTSLKRSPWYSVNPPNSPPRLLFTYATRGTPRFVQNDAGAFALTNLLTAEPHREYSGVSLTELCELLNESLAAWAANHPSARSYRDGLTKIEPGDFHRIPAIRVPKAKTVRRLDDYA